jgi:hypothetical protein
MLNMGTFILAGAAVAGSELPGLVGAPRTGVIGFGARAAGAMVGVILARKFVKSAK